MNEDSFPMLEPEMSFFIGQFIKLVAPLTLQDSSAGAADICHLDQAMSLTSHLQRRPT